MFIVKTFASWYIIGHAASNTRFVSVFFTFYANHIGHGNKNFVQYYGHQFNCLGGVMSQKIIM